MPWILLLLIVSPAWAAVEDLIVAGTTATQIVVTYTAPGNAECTVEASKNPGYTPLAPDLDAGLYAGSNVDSRAGSITEGRHRVFVIGRQGPSAIEKAADGYTRSRALEADTTYYVRVNCGADTAATTARTANIPLGDSRGEALAVAADRPFAYESVSVNPAAVPEFTDPYTGVLIKRSTATAGFGYGRATTSGADCNKTLAGVSASCVFDEAFGSGWTAATGTLTDAVRADDSNYAEYGGTLQEPLYIRISMSGKYPTSSTPEEVGGMAFQNIILRALTTDGGGGGGTIDLCWVEDVTAASPQCISPLLQTDLTASESTIRFCKDAPCSAADAPGDVMLDRFPAQYTMYPNARVYNTAGDLAAWKFAGSGAQAACGGLYTGQSLAAMDSRNFALRTVSVTAKSCEATPPQVTVNLSYDLTHNGTTGVTLFKVTSFSQNRNVGIRVRKVSTTSASTIKIGYALWRAAVSTPFQFALGSGGFGKRCQIVPTAQGEYLCHFNQHIVGVSYGADGLNLKNYGYVYINTNYLGVSGLQSSVASYNCLGSAAVSDTLWSDTVPGRFYCLLPSNYNNPATGTVDNRKVVVEMNLDISAEKPAGNPNAGGSPGLGNMAQRITYTTNRVITTCLNTCGSPEDDYTPYAQFKRFAPGWEPATFGRLELVSVQGNLLFMTVMSGSQDSHGWVFALDLGNGQPVGSGYAGNHGNTQHAFAGFLMSGSQACRWCALHTYQAPMKVGGATYTVLEGSDKCALQVTGLTNLGSCSIGSGTCSACPGVTVDGYDYTGKNWCSTLQVTSSWNGAWGATPSGFEAGDPIAPNGCDNGAPNVRYWGQKLAVGDFIYRNGEYARVLARNGDTLTIVRGWGAYKDAGVYGPKTHSSGDTWTTKCAARGRNPETANPELPQAAAWWPTFDPDGNDPNYTYVDFYQNHAFHAGEIAVKPEYNVALFDSTSPASLKAAAAATLSLPSSFAGAGVGNCSGNACEKHPSFGQVVGDANARSWFADVHPRLFHANNGPNGVELVAGKTFIYRWKGAQALRPRHFDLEVYTAVFPLRRVDTLSDSVGDTGKWCWAVVADDCFAGSVANHVYFVNEAFDTTFISSTAYTCRELEFGAIQGDICFGNTGGISASTTQWRVPTRAGTWLNGSAMRVVSKYARGYRESATENVKIDPLGKALFARGNYYLWTPRFPGISSRSLETFAAIQLDIPSVPANTATVLVEFGYNENLQCSRNRGDVCVAETSALDEAMPYKFAQENLTGLSCPSSCSVTIPGLHNRVLYYRVKYRNGSGSTIATDPMKTLVVN